MILFSQNPVRIAVDRMGGATKASNAMGVSNTTIHAWIKRQYITDIDKAKRMAQLAGMDMQQLRSTL